MSNETSVVDDERKPSDDKGHDLVWGGQNIADEFNRTLSQFYDLHRSGALKGIVAKYSHKGFVASRRKLRDFPSLKMK